MVQFSKINIMIDYNIIDEVIRFTYNLKLIIFRVLPKSRTYRLVVKNESCCH